MLVYPNAKINLGLNIISKRPDGYHNIESVFYPIEWSDALEIIKSDSFGFSFSGLTVSGDIQSNLITKAWELFKSETKIAESVNIHLHKILPMGAGIGGGSADAAFALKTLNQIFETDLSVEQLESMASRLGSDCPFFIRNKVRFCYGKGTEFEDIELSLKDKYIVLVNPDIHVSTAEAYSGVSPHKPILSVKEIVKRPVHEWKGSLVNDFEESVVYKYPIIGQIKEKLYQEGALYASMTGSGSTVYGIFENQIQSKSWFSNYVVWEGQLN